MVVVNWMKLKMGKQSEKGLAAVVGSGAAGPLLTGLTERVEILSEKPFGRIFEKKPLAAVVTRS
jgi:hypothetical protein